MKEPTPVPPPALTAYHFVLRNPKLRADQRPRLVNYANNVEAMPVAFQGEVCPTAFVGGKRALAKTLVDRYTKLGWVDVTEAFRAEQQAAEEAAAAPDTAGAPMLPPGPESPPGEVKPPEVKPPAEVQAAPKPPEETPALVPVDTADEVKVPAQEERPPVLSEQPPEKPPETGAELGGHRPPETARSMTLDLPASGRGVPPETPARGRGGASRGGPKGGKAKSTPDPAPAPAAAG
jgi:hypothetical protein